MRVYLVLSYIKTLFELCVRSDYHNPRDIKASVFWCENSTVWTCALSRRATLQQCYLHIHVWKKTAHVVIDSYQTLFTHNRSACELRSSLPKVTDNRSVLVKLLQNIGPVSLRRWQGRIKAQAN